MELNENTVTNRIIVSISGQDEILDYTTLGLTFDSDERTVLSAINPIIKEKYNQDLQDDAGTWLYKTRKALNSQNIHVIPNSTAGIGR